MRPVGPPNSLSRDILPRAAAALTDGWSQWNAACLLDLDQPRMSDLRRAKLECFSLDRLVRLLWRLDRRLEITLVDTGRRRQLYDVNVNEVVLANQMVLRLPLP